MVYGSIVIGVYTDISGDTQTLLYNGASFQLRVIAPGAGNEFIGNFDYVGFKDVMPDVESGSNSMMFAVFQGMFAIITPALITGAVAERFKFKTYLVFLLIWMTVVYAPIAHWVWSDNGWILGIGASDFAGGTVVHINAEFQTELKLTMFLM